MSRSKRKTPITGITTSKSDRYWKKKCNRKLRRVPIDKDLPSGGRYKPMGGDEWYSSKDGKHYYGEELEEKHWRK